MHSPLPMAMYGDWSHCVWTATFHHRSMSLNSVRLVLTGRQQRHVDRGRDATFTSRACLLYDHRPPPVVESRQLFCPKYSWPDDRHICCTSVPMNGLAIVQI